jgi:excisionase family DNA binding protein
MAKRIGFGADGPGDTAAVFVRIPRAEADKLDRAAYELRRPKQAIVAALVARYLDPTRPEALEALELAPGRLTVGRHSFRADERAEVLTLAEAAALLQSPEAAVRELAERGDLPARRIGGEWRFLRRAVLDWLAGAEAGAAAPADAAPAGEPGAGA